MYTWFLPLFVVAGDELRVVPLGSSPGFSINWWNISLFPSLGSFPHLENKTGWSPCGSLQY